MIFAQTMYSAENRSMLMYNAFVQSVLLNAMPSKASIPTPDSMPDICAQTCYKSQSMRENEILFPSFLAMLI